LPELPEVEAVCRKIRAEALGTRIIQLRIARPGIARPQKVSDVERQVNDCLLQQVNRRGKNILLHLSNGVVLHVHLRMTGNLYVIPDVRFRPTATRAWLELEGGRGIVFEDPRALGKVHAYKEADLHKVLKKSGVEPLSEEFTVAFLIEVSTKSRKPAKLFLMDQKPVAGLGNIYVAESLWRARIHPQKPMNEVSKPKLKALHAAIQDILKEGVESAVLAYAEPGSFSEAEGFECAVYDREDKPCLRCKRKIKRIPQGGRSTYFCAGCQK
jgi:formamidopyrimidine-DNA glycosylase